MAAFVENGQNLPVDRKILEIHIFVHTLHPFTPHQVVGIHLQHTAALFQRPKVHRLDAGGQVQEDVFQVGLFHQDPDQGVQLFLLQGQQIPRKVERRKHHDMVGVALHGIQHHRRQVPASFQGKQQVINGPGEIMFIQLPQRREGVQADIQGLFSRPRRRSRQSVAEHRFAAPALYRVGRHHMDIPSARVEQTIAADAPSRPVPDRTGAASAASAQPASPSAAPRAKSGNPRSEAAPSPGAGAALSRIPKWAFVLGAVVLVLIVALVSCLPKGGQNSQNSQTAQASSLYDNLTEEETLDMRTVTINGVSYTLPMTLQSLLDNGWLTEDPDALSNTLVPNQTTLLDTLVNEYGELKYSLKNESLNTQPIAECTVTHLSLIAHILNDNYLDQVVNEAILPGGLSLGSSTRQDVLLAFPGAVQDGDNLTVETPFCRLDFTCDEDVLISFSLSSYVAPATPETASVSTERPAEYGDEDFINTYALPDFTVETDTLQTGLPLIVEDLTNAGWTVERQPDYLPANSSANVYLRLDTRTTMKLSADNYTNNAILPQYGILGNVTFSTDLTDCIPAENAKLLYKGEVLAQIGQTDRNTLYQSADKLGLSMELPYDNQLTIVLSEQNSIWCVFDNNNILKSFTIRNFSSTNFFYNYEEEQNSAS